MADSASMVTPQQSRLIRRVLAHDLDEAFADAVNIPDDAPEHDESQIDVRDLLMRRSGGRAAWAFILHTEARGVEDQAKDCMKGNTNTYKYTI